MATDHRPALLAAALAAARRGWHVFPLRPGTKKFPILTSWEQRATTDPEQIRRWWNTARYNIGIACGPSRLLVIDLDMPKHDRDLSPQALQQEGVGDGIEHLALLARRAGAQLPFDTFTVTTTSGGTHLYFQLPDDLQLRSTEGSKNGLGWKIDTRAGGGYIVGPRSLIGQRRYEVVDARQAAMLPAWLAHALLTLHPAPPAALSQPAQLRSGRASAYLAAIIRDEQDKIGHALPDTHNITLYQAALTLGQLVAGGDLPPVAAKSALLIAAQALVASPCDCTQREVERTIDSGLRGGARKPRRVSA